MRTEPRQNATLESVFRPVLAELARLVRQLQNGQSTRSDVEDLQVYLETLPLSSDEFGLATNRLRNAHRYLQAEEPGAAQWELNALKQHLRTRLDAQAIEPRRRRRG